MKKVLALLLAATMTIAMAGCGNKTEQTDENTTNETEATDAETETPAAEEPVAEEPVAEEPAVELSGSVVVYMPSPSGLADKIAEAFTAKTGVTVEQFQGTTGEILARLEAEAENPVADVVILASWSDGLSLKADGVLATYEPANADQVVEGWIDADSTLFGYSASALGVIYNTTLISELNADWTELADAQYADMLAIPDPVKSGSCKDFLSGYYTALGEESYAAFQTMAENGMVIPGANKAALESVLTGETAILVGGVDYNAYSNIAKGEPIQIYYPASGTVVNPRPAMILNTAPNMTNAQAFVDYLLSDECQQLVADAYLIPGRADITCTNRANLSDINMIPTDWEAMMEVSDELAQEMVDWCAE